MEEPKTTPQEEFYYSADPTPLNEILGAAPGWLLRSGIGVVAFFVFVLLGGSILFRYPDLIEAPVVVLADHPPVNLIAGTSGKLERLLAKEGEKVEKGDIIAVIESPLIIDDLIWLRNLLKNDLSNQQTKLPQNLNLGSLQGAYNEWSKALHDKEQFQSLNYHSQRIAFLETQLTERGLLASQTSKQAQDFVKIYQLSQVNFKRDSTLLSTGFVSQLEFEATQAEYLSRRISLEDYQKQLVNLQLQKNDVQASLLETKMDYEQRKSDHKLRLQITLESLRSQLAQWEKNFAFIAPVGGQLVFAGVWSQNQQVSAGDQVFSIIPDDYGQFVARGKIPLFGSGKVKVGDRVNIRLTNFPYQDFGVLQGEVIHVAAIPAGDHYPVQVSLLRQLETSYKIDLGKHVMLEGLAQIITEDISLFNRMLNPLRSLRKNR